MKIEAELETVTDGKPVLIIFRNIYFQSQGSTRNEAAVLTTSAAMVSCWIRFKNIKDFNIADLKDAFPKWQRYSRSSLLKILGPLIREKVIAQMKPDEFKVMKI